MLHYYNEFSSNHARLSFLSLLLLSGGGAVPPAVSGGAVDVANRLGAALLAGSTKGARLLLVGHGEKGPGP